METIIRKGIYSILKIFYNNGNSPIHLRELARKTNLNENSITRFLNELVASKILISKKEGNVRKFEVNSNAIKEIFPLFDSERMFKLPFDRRKSIGDYISKIKIKPWCLILFGSVAKGNSKKDSDIDLLEISEFKEKNFEIIKGIESERGIKLQITRLSLKELNQAIFKKDFVIRSAIKSGFPVFGKDFFYEVIKNE
jgi:predicted nucleotidyltransferase